MIEELQQLAKGIFVILIWIGIWGILEVIIDELAHDNKMIRVIANFGILIVGIFFLWIMGYNFDI